MKKRNPLSAFLVLFFLLPLAASAKEYPERIGNTEVIYFDDPIVEMIVKIELRRRARTSIDEMTYAKSADAFGLSLLQATRKVQQDFRVPVRSIYDLSATMVEGKGEAPMQPKRLIEDPRLALPGEVRTGHPVDKVLSGLSLTDYAHGKAALFDYGTKNAVATFGGRNDNYRSHFNIDSGFLIRPIDPDQPYLGTDLHSNFDAVWKTLSEISDRHPIKKKALLPDEALLTPVPELQATPEQRQKAAEILELLNHPPVVGEVLRNYQFRPQSSRLRTNELLKNLLHQVTEDGAIDRSAFPNDIHDSFAKEVRSFKGTIHHQAYTFAPTRETFSAYVDFIKNGNTLNIYTNGDLAHASMAGTPIPVYYTVEAIDALLKATRGATGKVNTYFLDPKKAEKIGLGAFLHRKLVTFLSPTNEKSLVTSGSDNLTYSSSKKNDELMGFFRDHRMAKKMVRQVLSEKSAYDKISPAMIQQMQQNTPLSFRCMRWLIKDIY